MLEGTTEAGDERPTGARRPIDPYIQGMRGLAVAVVVLYHVGATGFGGGFVGVDIFFVISGFVITRRLVDGAEEHGRVRLRDFYAARVRRLGPTIAVVFIATWVWLCITYSTPWLGAILGEARAAATGWLNVKYTLDATRYGVGVFGPNGPISSPFTHFWSLGVEEQFYVVFPVVAAFVLRPGARRFGGVPWLRRIVWVVAAASVAEWWYLSSSGRDLPAFYLLEARAWQLAVGVALALSIDRVRTLASVRVVRIVALLGGPLLVVFVVRHWANYNASAPHLLAVVAAAVMIVAAMSDPSTPFERALHSLAAWGPLPLLGAISFPLYMWHWLVLFEVPMQTRALPRGWQMTVVVATSIALAVITHLAIERPLRHQAFLSARPVRSFAAGGVVLTVLLVGATVTARTGMFSPPTLDTTPSLEDALGVFRGRGTNCLEIPDPAVPGALCVLGVDDPDAPIVALIGDSHADHWTAALDGVARRHGLRLAVYTRAGCPWMDLDDADGWFGDSECGTWRRQMQRDLAGVRPAALVLAAFDRRLLPSGSTRVADAAEEFTSQFDPSVVRIVLGDAPVAPFDTASCLATSRLEVQRCDVLRVDAVDRPALDMMSGVADRIDARFVDPTSMVCPRQRCPSVRGRLLVWFDGQHLTRQFAATLADPLDALIGPDLARVG